MTRARVVIENVTPQVDGGRFAAKRIRGDTVSVSADVFADGHDLVACAVLFRRHREPEWRRVAMRSAGNDRFAADFTVTELGRYEFTVEAWVDHLATWKRDITKKRAAGQDTRVDELRGTQIERVGVDPDIVMRHEPPLAVEVERELARFSSWYELFPRSTSDEPGKHGSFDDCAARLPYVASMGFDILYLPPIHPIGFTQRKGPNNTVGAAQTDVGSPWAIGAQIGGHKATIIELGTLDDFLRLRRQAAERQPA